MSWKIERLGLALLAIGVSGPAFWAAPNGQDSLNGQVIEHFRSGQQDLRSGRVSDAVAQFKAVVELAPGLSEGHINLGLAYHLAGEYKLAVAELERGLAESPNVFGANLVLGTDELRLGLAARALGPLERATRMDASSQQAWSSLAEGYLDLGRYLEAARSYNAAFGSSPTADNLLRLGHAYLQMSSQLTARMAHRYAGTAWARRLAGDLLAERQLWSDAARRYQLALALDPTQPGLHASLADVLLAQGKTAAAGKEFQLERLAEAHKPGWPACKAHQDYACIRFLQASHHLVRAQLMMLGQAQFALKRYRQAGNTFGAAWARNDHDPQTLYWLIQSYSKVADGYFSELAGRYPDSAQAHQLEAETYRARGEDSKAAQQYQRAVGIQPRNAALHEALGELYLNKHELSKAQQQVKEALELEPTRARALYLMGRLEIGLERPQAAIPYLEKALRYSPDLLEARASLGLAYLRSGRPALAVVQLQQSQSLDYYGDLHYMLYQAYRDLGKTQLAEDALAASQALRRKTAARDQALIRSAEAQ